jgi:hypothetical protein
MATLSRELRKHSLMFLLLLGVLMFCAGCGSSGSSSGPSGQSQTVVNQTIYVSQGAEVDSFPISSSLAQTGNVAPATALTGTNTTFSDTHRTAFDSTGRMYETDYGNGVVDIFPSGATGNVAPTAYITVSNASGIAIDASDNVYVSDYDDSIIYVYPAVASTATGAISTSPTYSIQGSTTTLNWPNGIALNTKGTQLWVANEDAGDVLCFTLPTTVVFGAQNLAPIATITGIPDTTATPASVTPFGEVHSVALDSSNLVYVTGTSTSNTGDTKSNASSGNNYTSAIYIYSSSAVQGVSGAATPVATITGSNTGLENLNGISLDYNNNIYVGNNADYIDGGNPGAEVLVFLAGSQGNVAPVATIGQGSDDTNKTGITAIHGVTIGPTPKS